MTEDRAIVTREEHSEALDFDLVAASIRSSSTDLATFVQVLGEKLELALPQRVKIDRRGLPGFSKSRLSKSRLSKSRLSKSPLSKSRRIWRIEVSLGDDRYLLTVQGAAIETRHAKAVRGVVLKTETLPLEAWIEGLARALTQDAQASEQSRLALEQMLSS